MDWTEINGVSLRYELAGHGTETVVFVHELGGSLESWDETLPAFQSDFRTLRYDQRGFGLSEKVGGTLALEDMLTDLAGLLDAVGIRERCHLVGSALGAGIAAAFAVKYPSRVDRLVLQSLVTHSNAQLRPHMAARAAEVEQSGMRPQVKTSFDRSYPEVLRSDRVRFERFRLRWVANDPQSFAAINRMLLDMDLVKELGRIACPTLVIGCAHDVMRTPAMVRELATMIPGARFVEADSGHFMHVQSPDLFAGLVLPFLQGKCAC